MNHRQVKTVISILILALCSIGFGRVLNHAELRMVWSVPEEKLQSFAGKSILGMLQAFPTLAHSPVGVATTVRNQVEATLDGVTHEMKVGELIFPNEDLRTGDDSQLEIDFRDSTKLSVGPKSHIIASRFVYESFEPDTGRFEIEASRGALTSVAHSQDKMDYEVIPVIDTTRDRGVILNLTQGIFRFISGKSNSGKSYQINTPAGTLRVKG
jgi:hypothetical protein